MKIRTEGASCSMRTDGQTDMIKPMVALRNFANPPKKVQKKEKNCFETLQSKIYVPTSSATNVHWKPQINLVSTMLLQLPMLYRVEWD